MVWKLTLDVIRCYCGFGECNPFWSISLPWNWAYFETIYAYENIHYVEISTVEPRSFRTPWQNDRQECIAFTKTSIRFVSDCALKSFVLLKYRCFEWTYVVYVVYGTYVVYGRPRDIQIWVSETSKMFHNHVFLYQLCSK